MVDNELWTANCGNIFEIRDRIKGFYKELFLFYTTEHDSNYKFLPF